MSRKKGACVLGICYLMFFLLTQFSPHPVRERKHTASWPVRWGGRYSIFLMENSVQQNVLLHAKRKGSNKDWLSICNSWLNKVFLPSMPPVWLLPPSVLQATFSDQCAAGGGLQHLKGETSTNKRKEGADKAPCYSIAHFLVLCVSQFLQTPEKSVS